MRISEVEVCVCVCVILGDNPRVAAGIYTRFEDAISK
jgi:hypothetical protein